MLDILLALLDPATQARYAALKQKVRTFVAEQRDPTPEEWADLNAETASLSSVLQQAAAALDEPTPPPA
jgi:hypothetical protein